MDPVPLIGGIAIGLAAAAPLGPINFLVIRNALRAGIAAGLVAGAGSVIGDGLLAGVSAFGVSAVARFVADYAQPLQLLGGGLMAAIGVRTATKSVGAEALAGNGAPVSALSQGATVLALTLTNPATFAGMLAMFAGTAPVMKLGGAPARAALAVAGVMTGSFLWWLFVSFVAARLGSRLSPRTLQRINRWSGLLIAGFGFALILDAAGA